MHTGRMSGLKPKAFRAVLEPAGDALRWVIARVPFDVAKTWPVRNGRRVKGEINGFPFRTALFPNSRDGGHVIVVNKKMQAGARAKAGETAGFVLEPDMEERVTTIPEELAKTLKAERGLRHFFDALSPSMRRDVGRFASEPKSAASRAKRAERIAEWMLLAMEGEQETPPILRVAFERRPEARAGWEAMTPTRRRRHLLSIFHYQSGEARARRAQAAVEDALRQVRQPGKSRKGEQIE